MFTNSPMKIEDIHSLTPYGQIVGGHITPIDHMYFEPKDRSLGRDVYEVRAIQDAYIFNISVRRVGAESQQEQKPEEAQPQENADGKKEDVVDADFEEVKDKKEEK